MFLIDNIFKYVKKKKSNDYYSLLVTEKAQSPSIIHELNEQAILTFPMKVLKVQ